MTLLGMDLAEKEPILSKGNSNENNDSTAFEVHVYKRRWWVTFVFSLVCIIQAMIWDTWGPIAESAELVFGWTDGTIAQIMNMSSIGFVIFVLPISMFLDIKGLRITLLFSSLLLVVSSVIRCITTDSAIFTPLAHISSLAQGIGGAVSFSGPALFSAVWFPLKQRETATAMVSLCNYLGVTLAFVIAPQLVPNPVHQADSASAPLSNTSYKTTTSNWNKADVWRSNTSTVEMTLQGAYNMDAMTAGVQHLMYLHASLAGLAFVLVVVYFPAKPPKPPSMTASLPRTNYREGLRNIISNVQLWIIVVAGSLPRAVIGSWIAVFDVVAKPLGVSQIDAGWIGFWHMLTGSLAGILFAKFSNLLNSRRKVLVISTTVVALISNIWLAMLCDRILAFNIQSLYVSCIILGIMVNGTVPLFYEISAETAYPVGEGVAGGFYTLVFVVFEIVFFSLLSIPGIGVSWMNWTCAGTLLVSLPLMSVFKERNKRYQIDVQS